ncbi:Pollen Ole e 1 allergen and extensin family protein [Hibiscus syriacus]|uniref:Pollen Ole e 1 allergen and extensin family protein n=1 Tax=Hibiscus syriacus TaxID=106335 RepID=A0A6A3A278_HIBSY|nr:Pollen Ole e 1 allergen and extensin family protein [Hibiscus syriacus]
MVLKNILFSAYFLLLLSLWAAAVLASDTEYNNLEKPNLEKERLLSTMIGIQGIVYCRSGKKLAPLQGAVARITCEDEKGYFFATISPYELEDHNRRLRNCRAVLELSPSEACDVPTDVNKAISGAPIGTFSRLHDKNIKLFTVGPFFFVPRQEAKSISDGY